MRREKVVLLATLIVLSLISQANSTSPASAAPLSAAEATSPTQQAGNVTQLIVANSIDSQACTGSAEIELNGSTSDTYTLTITARTYNSTRHYYPGEFGLLDTSTVTTLYNASTYEALAQCITPPHSVYVSKLWTYARMADSVAVAGPSYLRIELRDDDVNRPGDVIAYNQTDLEQLDLDHYQWFSWDISSHPIISDPTWVAINTTLLERTTSYDYVRTVMVLDADNGDGGLCWRYDGRAAYEAWYSVGDYDAAMMLEGYRIEAGSVWRPDSAESVALTVKAQDHTAVFDGHEAILTGIRPDPDLELSFTANFSVVFSFEWNATLDTAGETTETAETTENATETTTANATWLNPREDPYVRVYILMFTALTLVLTATAVGLALLSVRGHRRARHATLIRRVLIGTIVVAAVVLALWVVGYWVAPTAHTALAQALDRLWGAHVAYWSSAWDAWVAYEYDVWSYWWQCIPDPTRWGDYWTHWWQATSDYWAGVSQRTSDWWQYITGA